MDDKTKVPVTSKEPTPEGALNVPETSTDEVSADEGLSVESPHPLDGYYLQNPFFYQLTNYFGIESGQYEAAKEELSAIADWAYQETGSKDMADLLTKVRELEDGIQRPTWGEKRYKVLYRYLKLAAQKQSVEKAMKAYQREDSYHD